MNAITSRFGTRFLVVTLLPTTLLAGYLGFLIAAGVPGGPPEAHRAAETFAELTGRELVALALLILAVSVATHPLQVPLIQIMEGYWRRLPLGPALSVSGVSRFRDEMLDIREILREVDPEDGWTAANAVADAERRQFWMPADENLLLPTKLGNVLRAGEMRAGQRYDLDLLEAFPRLVPLMSPTVLKELSDRRNQLDAAVRLSAFFAIATLVGLGLLLPQTDWMFLPLVTLSISWASYQAAVAAARGYSTALSAAIDLHHLDLFDGLHLRRPANYHEELRLTGVLGKLFRGEALAADERGLLKYVAPAKDERD